MLGNASAFPVESEGERAAAERNFESTRVRPIIINNVLHSARILGDEGTSLREAALALWVSAPDFDRIVRPETMVGHPRRDLGIEVLATVRRDDELGTGRDARAVAHGPTGRRGPWRRGSAELRALPRPPSGLPFAPRSS